MPLVTATVSKSEGCAFCQREHPRHGVWRECEHGSVRVYGLSGLGGTEDRQA